MKKEYEEKIYAGVLGKIIGVYLGRPVEGWSYDQINNRFGYVDYYVAHKTGAPFIVPDDDISGTFTFYRGLEDSGYSKDISSRDIGEAWLNYIVENKTVLWWGGLARSTEHSAYLRLKQGYEPPYTGSGEANGMAIAEQIGSQIFIDTWAMVNPGNPERAAKMAREAAVVSHDGIAVECAVYLAAMEALAFDIKDLDLLLSEGRKYINDNKYGKQLNMLLDEVIFKCESSVDWRDVRDWIEENHNYARYQGNCPMVTNHLAVIMALKMGKDSFRKSISIAASAAWDTDCNAGNVGCLNAIRLGLDAINEEVDLRGPVADRMYVVSTDGGDCISDAVRETRKIVKAAEILNDSNPPAERARYEFEYPGSVQGFLMHPGCSFGQAAKKLYNKVLEDGSRGLAIDYEGVSGSVAASVSVQVYVDPTPKAAPDTSYFEVFASPSLYSGQTVKIDIDGLQDKNPELRFFIDYYDGNDEITTMDADVSYQIQRGTNHFEWMIPDTKGRSVYRLGINLVSTDRKDGTVVIRKIDWKGSPILFHMGLAKDLSPEINPFVTRTKWMMAFMDSTTNTCPDYLSTFSISHSGRNGVLSIGTHDWDNYSVTSVIQYVHAQYAGLIARAKGHRRYYAAVVKQGKVAIILRQGKEIKELASADYPIRDGNWYNIEFAVNGTNLSFIIDGKEILTAFDSTYKDGSCGYVVDEGGIVGKTFTVKKI